MPWILLLVFSTLCLTVATLSCKVGLRGSDADTAAAWRVSALLVIFLLRLPDGGFLDSLTANVSGFFGWLFLLLGCLSFGACWLFYHGAMKSGSSVKATAITRAATVVSPLLLLCFGIGRFSLTSAEGILRAAAMLLILLGTCLLLIRDGVTGHFRLLNLLSLLTATATVCFFSLSGLSQNSTVAIGLGLLSGFLVSWITVLAKGKRRAALDIKLRDFLFLLLSAVALSACRIFLSSADCSSAISRLFLSLSLQLLAPLCFVFLKEKPSKQTVVALLILLLGEFLFALLYFL